MTNDVIHVITNCFQITNATEVTVQVTNQVLQIFTNTISLPSTQDVLIYATNAVVVRDGNTVLHGITHGKGWIETYLFPLLCLLFGAAISPLGGWLHTLLFSPKLEVVGVEERHTIEGTNFTDVMVLIKCKRGICVGVNINVSSVKPIQLISLAGLSNTKNRVSMKQYSIMHNSTEYYASVEELRLAKGCELLLCICVNSKKVEYLTMTAYANNSKPVSEVLIKGNKIVKSAPNVDRDYYMVRDDEY